MKTKYQVAVEHFQQIATSEPNTWPDHRWHGEIHNCDICSRPMSPERFMVDGPASASANPMWGNLCVVCAHKYSSNIGWGKAQLYERSSEGEWALASGGPPEDGQR